MRKLNRILTVLLILVSVHCTSAQVVSSLVQNVSPQRFEALTLNHNGFLYAPSMQDGIIYKIAADGSTWSTIITGLGAPLGGAVDADMNFYFSEFGTGRVIKIRPDDTWNVFATGFAGPTGIVVNPTGDTLYVSNYNNDAIYKLAMADSSVHTWIQGNGISGPDGLVFDPAGNLYIANFDDNRVYKVNSQGQISWFATLSGSTNSGYIALVDSTFYIAGFNGHKIFSINMMGNIQVIAGTGIGGFQNGAASQAKFFRPNGIAASATGDSLFITDGNALGQIRVLDLKAIPIGIAEQPALDSRPQLTSVGPNPFHSSTKVEYDLPYTTSAHLMILDTQGKTVATIWKGVQEAGHHEITWNGCDNSGTRLAAGTYVLVMEVGEVRERRKIVLVN